MFPVFEQPDLKATFEFIVDAPAKWEVISNSPTPKPESLTADTARWHFPTTKRMSSYITALIAGPYAKWDDQLVSSDGRTIPLGVFCRKSLAEFMDPEYIFDKTKAGFAYFEKAFDYPYPFEKYDQLWVPDFNAGAMENAGAITFTENYVFRSAVSDATKERRVVTILHELAHMWFGDLVTMRWWNDLWLNESFAEYASTLATADATEWDQAWTTFASLEKNWAYRQDQLPSTHPIVAEIRDLEDVQVNFDGITYAKCKKMHGTSLSLTQPYPAPPKPEQGNIQTINDIGTAPDNGAFIVSTYSLPEGARSTSGDLAVYNCKRKGSYAQCDGGICFTNTSGKNFPGLGKLTEDEVMCSCPITTAKVYEVFGPYPCPKTAAEFDQVCAAGSRSTKNGEYLRIGSPGRGSVQTFSDCLELKPEPVYLNRCVRPSK